MDNASLGLNARRVTTGPSRRSMLGLVAGGLVGAAFGFSNADAAADGRRNRSKRRKRRDSLRGDLVTCPKNGNAETCGDGCCPTGTVCCNALHGICVSPGKNCAQ
ncbi:MAG: hypothetical protein H0U10_01010 [Chloroflexia bacterium]|nr:hypothetical protein [Chloroflexia bacterium]